MIKFFQGAIIIAERILLKNLESLAILNLEIDQISNFEREDVKQIWQSAKAQEEVKKLVLDEIPTILISTFRDNRNKMRGYKTGAHHREGMYITLYHQKYLCAMEQDEIGYKKYCTIYY